VTRKREKHTQTANALDAILCKRSLSLPDDTNDFYYEVFLKHPLGHCPNEEFAMYIHS